MNMNRFFKIEFNVLRLGAESVWQWIVDEKVFVPVGDLTTELKLKNKI